MDLEESAGYEPIPDSIASGSTNLSLDRASNDPPPVPPPMSDEEIAFSLNLDEHHIAVEHTSEDANHGDFIYTAPARTTNM